MGMPFLPTQDHRVVDKIDYLNRVDDMKAKKKKARTNWQLMQTMKSVNQAIGRVIRHKDDYGVVIFMDSRYRYPTNFNGIS